MIFTSPLELDLPGMSLLADDTEFPVTGMNINGNVDGDGIVWTLDATFTNPLDAPAEATFTLPLPHGGAVVGLTLTIGDRVIEADIKERGQAKEEYEEAKEQGHTAALFEQDRAEIFTLSVGNIHPGEAISVAIEVHDIVAVDGTEASLRMPTMIKPRFIPDSVVDADAINPPRVSGAAPLHAQVEINFADDAVDLICETVPTAEISVRQVIIRDSALTCDIVLRWTQPQTIAKAKWVPDADNADEGTLEVTIRVPEKKDVPRHRKAVQIMFDRSGSMSHHYLEWARQITKDLIASLTDDDLIHILTFDSTIDVLGATEHGFTPATRTVKQALLAELAKVTARGGTNLTGALKMSGAALALLDDQEDSQDLERIAVLITDGAYGDEASATFQREKNLKGARVIAVAIGEDANGYLEVLAANGVCVYVSSDAGVSAASAKVMSRVASAAHSHAQLVAAGLTHQAPSYAPDIYPDVKVVMTGRMPRPTAGAQVEVTADEGLVVALPIELSADKSATTRWAKQHIISLDYAMMTRDFAQLGEDARSALEQEIVNVSVKYRVLSKYTAWIAVDRSRTTDQVIVRKLVQPSYGDVDAMPFISYSLNSQNIVYSQSLTSASYNMDPFADVEWNLQSSHEPKSIVRAHGRKSKSDLSYELDELVNKIALCLAFINPEDMEEIVEEILLEIAQLLNNFSTRTLGKRFVTNLQATAQKLMEYDFQNPGMDEVVEMLTEVRVILTGHPSYPIQ